MDAVSSRKVGPNKLNLCYDDQLQKFFLVPESGNVGIFSRDPPSTVNSIRHSRSPNLLGGSWVVISGVISPRIWAITISSRTYYPTYKYP